MISFPPGKGDPRWQRTGQELFLGIDHTAIAVKDTERSLKFYQDLLGFRVTGTSLNYGTEQEHLNHVFGSRVRITSLRFSAGPGIEFLEYLAPRNGRPAPPQTAANDLWSVHTEIVVPDLISAAAELNSRTNPPIASEAEEVQPLAEAV